MPKGPQGQRRPSDVIGNAVMVAKIATGEAKDTELSHPAKRESGLAGGKARIDMQEASLLFHRVRGASDAEKALVDKLGNRCRIPNDQVIIENLTDVLAAYEQQEAENANASQREPSSRPKSNDEAKKRGAEQNGKDSPEAAGA